MQSTRKTVSVTELKAKLSEHLRKVKAGESVIVTERGRPIAVMEPLPAPDIEAETAELIELGLIRRGRRPLSEDFWDRERPEDPEGKVLAALLEERQTGR